jgi:hypothetical protein
MGQNASGVRIQEGSTFAGVDTVAIGRVLYDSGFPIVPADNLWVPARENPARFSVVPIGDIHIFMEETNPTPAMETNFRWIGMAETPIRTAFELDTEEESSDLGLSKLPRLHLKANPTQPALEVEEEVEDHRESAMVTQALETLRYCLVAFIETTLGSASNEDGSPGESILEALNKSGDSEDCDSKGYDFDEYDATMKIYEAEIAQEELEKKVDHRQASVCDQQGRRRWASGRGSAIPSIPRHRSR